MHIAPALEKRLATSPVVGHTGEIKLDFYRGGLRMVFEQGRLAIAEPWRVPLYDSNASGGFPPLVFLQVLFGHRSIETLRQAFPDVSFDAAMTEEHLQEDRSEEHTSELQSPDHLVCRLLLEKK